MNETRDLLERNVTTRLKEALSYDANSDEAKEATEESIKMIDRMIELEKLELEKAKEERAVEEQKKNQVAGIVKDVVVPVSVKTLEIGAKFAFMYFICNFEKNDTFVSTPGRSTGSWFKW